MQEWDELIHAARKRIEAHNDNETRKHHIEIWISANEHVTGVEELLGLGKLVQQKNLRVGDLWILIDGIVAYIFERKTISDAIASVGERSHHQKFGIQCFPIPAHRVLYLYEGQMITPKTKAPHQNHSPNGRKGASQYSILVASQVNSVVRDGLGRINTSHKRETIYYWFMYALKVIEFADKTLDELKAYPKTPADFNPLEEQARIISEGKDKKSMTPSDEDINKAYCLAYKVEIVKNALENPRSTLSSMLQSSIRGLSADMAIAISAHYSCMSDFDDRATAKDIANIKYRVKNSSKSRRVGDAVAKRAMFMIRGE